MLTVRTSENTVITSFRLITERQDFSSVRTAENTVRARARIHGNAGLSLNNVVFVSDRGYSDAKNIKDCLRNKLGFLFNVQCEMPGSFAQELIDEERENLRDLNRMDWLTKVFQMDFSHYFRWLFANFRECSLIS